MYLALYRRYRPQHFADVVGQNSAISVIKKAVSHGKIGHAYLFSGPRGCGKTSVARLIAKAVNCHSIQPDSEPCGSCESCLSITNGDNLDIIEIDGASNNGVDEVRELKSHVALSPFACRYKVYIIDEVHMLSIAAFNALLKTIEEPPENVIFILATTEPYKVPVTIRSRCQHIPFHRISERDIQAKLATIAVAEGLEVEEEAIWELSRQADGALRDALSLMEQAITLGQGTITLENVTRLLGGASYSELEKLFSSFRMDPSSAYYLLEEVFARGASPVKIIEGLFILSKNLWIANTWGFRYLELLSLSNGEKKFLQEEAVLWDRTDLSSVMDFCVDILPRVRAGMRTDVLSGLIFSKIIMMSPSSDFPSEKPFTETENITVPPPENVGVEEKSRKSEMQKREPVKEFTDEIRTTSFKDKTCNEVKPDNVSEPDITKSVSQEEVENVSSPEPVLKENQIFHIGKREWKSVLEILKEDSIVVFAALLSAKVLLKDKNLLIEFPQDARAAFKMLCLERNSYMFQDICTEKLSNQFEAVVIRYGNEEKHLVCTASQTDEDIYDTPQAGSIEQTNLFSTADSVAQVSSSPTSTTSTDETSVEPSDVNRPPVEDQYNNSQPGVTFKNVVQEILNYSNGELILLKNQNQESFEEEVE